MAIDALQADFANRDLRAGSGRTSGSMIETGLAAIAGSLLAILYFQTAIDLEWRWRVDPASSHGYLIPLAAAWLLRLRLLQNLQLDGQRVPVSDFAIGIVAIVVGIGLHVLSVLAIGVSLDGAGLVLLLFGLVWCWGGQPAAGKLGAVVLFLIFMVPLPFVWQQPVGELLQHIVSVTSDAAISMCGLSVHREGYILHLPGHVLEVAQGCSGIRQITVFLGISTFLGLVGGNKVHCAVMLIFSIPIAVVANTLRITMTGLITWYLGPAWAQGVLHDVEGLITVLIGLTLLWWLSRWCPDC